jgi:hypothetical protein
MHPTQMHLGKHAYRNLTTSDFANTAFSLLADLSNSGEPENPASPPSIAASPALSKVTPVPETAPAEKESKA